MLFYVIMMLTKNPTIAILFYCSFQIRNVFRQK